MPPCNRSRPSEKSGSVVGRTVVASRASWGERSSCRPVMGRLPWGADCIEPDHARRLPALSGERSAGSDCGFSVFSSTVGWAGSACRPQPPDQVERAIPASCRQPLFFFGKRQTIVGFVVAVERPVIHAVSIGSGIPKAETLLLVGVLPGELGSGWLASLPRFSDRGRPRHLNNQAVQHGAAYPAGTERPGVADFL